MNSYSYATAPATVSAFAAGMIMFGTSGISTVSPQAVTVEKIKATYGAAVTISSSAHLRRFGVSPTMRANQVVGATAVVSADVLLTQASVTFVNNVFEGLEPLGNEFLGVVEENFWDLVLR